MSAFSQFFGKLLQSIGKDIGAFFQSIINFFVSLWKTIISNFSYYKSIFDNHSVGFNGLGWVLFVLSIILVIALMLISGTATYVALTSDAFVQEPKTVIVEDVDVTNEVNG